MNNVLEPINWTALKHKHDVCELMHCNQSHCKEYSGTEDEKVYFFEPLEKEISVEDMQKIVDANEKLVKELKDQ